MVEHDRVSKETQKLCDKFDDAQYILLDWKSFEILLVFAVKKLTLNAFKNLIKDDKSVFIFSVVSMSIYELARYINS